METLPCSRVADKELHKPHTYYFGGSDVQCAGYSPAQFAESDQAETPEEFYGLSSTREIVEDPPVAHSNCAKWTLMVDHDRHEWVSGTGVLFSCQGYDSELERLLYEEEVLELKEKYRSKINLLWFAKFEAEDIAWVLDEPEQMIADVIRQMDLVRIEEEPKDDVDEEFELSLLSFFVLLTLVFVPVSFIAHAIVC